MCASIQWVWLSAGTHWSDADRISQVFRATFRSIIPFINTCILCLYSFSTLILLVGHQEEHLAHKNWQMLSAGACTDMYIHANLLSKFCSRRLHCKDQDLKILTSKPSPWHLVLKTSTKTWTPGFKTKTSTPGFRDPDWVLKTKIWTCSCFHDAATDIIAKDSGAIFYCPIR